jgi:acyl-CoA thioester hydrolase
MIPGIDGGCAMWDAPIIAPSQSIESGWIDYNGHLNMAFYNVLFDRGVDHVYDLLGIGADYVREADGSCFTMEVHVSYLSELTGADQVAVSFQLVDYDAKRLHFFQEMRNAANGELAATSEQLALHVDMKSRRSAPFPDAALERIGALHGAHAALPQPDRLGRTIGIRRTSG